MNMIKRILIMILMAISAVTYADKKTPADKAKEKADEMQKTLNLTPEQYKNVADLYKRSYQAIDDFEAKDPTKKNKKNYKKAVSEKRNAELKKILNKDQFKKYEEIKKAEKAKEEAEKKEIEKMKK